MTTNSKYVLTADSGNTLLDLRLNAGLLSLVGQTATIVGTAAADYVYASLGTNVDWSAPSTGVDVMYLDGRLQDYDVTISGAVVTLTRTDPVNGVTSTYKLNAGGSSKFAFTDGSIDASAILAQTAGAPDAANAAAVLAGAAINSLATPDAADGTAATQRVSLQNAGIVTATALMGKLIISGSSGVDQVYVKAGANVDATLIGGSTDIIWMTGNWADYTKTVKGNTLQLSRTINGHTETVLVAAGSGVLNDKLMFADGYIMSKDALTNNTALDLKAAGGVMSQAPGQHTDWINLGGVISDTVTISDDTGTSATDAITKTAAQTIKGSYTGTLEDGDAIQISVDGGVTWTSATLKPAAAGGGTFEVAATLIEGVQAVQVRVLSANGPTLDASRQHTVTINHGGTVTLDTHVPTGTVAVSLAGDAYINNAEAADAAFTNVAIKVTLGADVQAGDIIQLQLNGTTSPANDAGSPYTVTAADLKAGFATINLPKSSLTSGADALNNAVHKVYATFTDVAGNTSTTATPVDITVDTFGPQATFVVSAVAVDGTTALHTGPTVANPEYVNETDAYLNNAEASIVLETTLDANCVAGDTIQFVIPGATSDADKLVGTAYTLTAADVAAGKAHILVNKTDIAGATVVDGVYNVVARTYDAAGNTHDSATLAITVDSVAVSANLTVSSYETDATTDRATGEADRFLANAETNVVLKVDSTAFGAASALKVGDVITLQVKDIAASTAAGHDVFVDLVHTTAGTGYAIGDTYKYTVTADDVSSDDGVGNAAYMQVQKEDLTAGSFNVLRAHLVDLAGNDSYSTDNLGITVQGSITLTMTSGITDLQVTSQIVLTSSQIVATAGHKLITFTNLANSGTKTGFDGEANTNTFSVYADDTRYVTIVGNKIIIKPPYDFDFANNYEITVEADAFLTAPDTVGGIPAMGTSAVGVGKMDFSTVELGTDVATAKQGQVMKDDGTVSSLAADGAKKWFAVDGTTTPTDYDLSGDDYAMVFKDQNPEGQNPDSNDGVAAKDFTANVTNFGASDLIYADDQQNSPAKLNNKISSQVIDYGNAGEQVLHFDPTATGWDGGTFNLLGEGGTLTAQNVLDRLNVANSTAVATAITAIDRVDTTGAVVTANLVGATTTDAQPLLVKVSAGVQQGDVVQMVYIDASGNVQNVGGAYTAISTDQTNGYVTVSLTRTQLLALPEQEGYNHVFAKITNTSGGISYSPFVGGDDGMYLDTVAPVPTLNFATGEDAHISSAENSVNLVVDKANIKIGDVLVLKNGATQLATHTVTAADTTTGYTFNVLKSSLNTGSNTLTLSSTDEAGNVGTSNIIVIRDQYVTYNGAIGLGPVIAGNDLQATAYDSAGNVLATSDIAANGTYSFSIDKSYTGAITIRVANKTASTATNDYYDEATHATVDIGAGGSIAAVVYANGSDKTVNISALTDLVARQLSTTSNVVTANAAQIAAYNLELAKQLVDATASQGITEFVPTFTVDSAGNSTISVAGKYGQLLAQISAQATVNSVSMDTLQTQLSNAITWTWDAGTGTATAALTADLAKQVVLLATVAKVASLLTGSDASAYLTAGDLASYGLTDVSTLSEARQSDLIARIVASADDGTAVDTMVELKALVAKEVALAKIQDYATDNTKPAPTVADYTAAGITGVTASDLFAVNSKMAGSAAAGTVPVDGVIQAVVNVGVAAHDEAIARIVAYADDSTASGVIAPSVSTYALAGITGVTADNLAAINVKVDAVNAGVYTTAATTVVTDIQTTVTSAIASYNSAFTALRAYILDGLANAEPDATVYTNLGLKAVGTADQIASANYYLNNVMADADASLADSSILSKLTLQQTALAKINAYAVSNTSAAPSVSDYIAAGIPAASVNNLSQLNTAVDAQAAIANAAALASVLDSVFVGVPSLLSIARAGTSVPNGAFTSDAYLNASEIAAGQTTKFTITFDRSVSGLTAANFGLTDASGNAIAGATPVLTLTNADSGIGKVWQVSVASLNGISSASVRLNLINNTGVTDTISGHALASSTYTAGQSYTVDTTNTLTLAAAAGEDLDLNSAENSVNLFVSAANLTVGDSLKLLKADGTQVGTTVVVTAAMLSQGGVTFNVPKANLSNGANVLTVQSTDVAGNAGSSSVTINVSEYIQVSGIIGLPSKVLSANDLAVAAYDAAGNLLGTGTINAASSTYTLNLLKSQTGYVQIKLTSAGTATDYWDTASAAQADMGSTTITTVISADGAAKTANITLLTDLASRLIGGIASPTAAQISAVNQAITKLLVSTTSTAEITSYNPDFVVDTAGTSTTSTASIYGQIMAQLAMQAKNAGSSLDVALSTMANGITWDGTNATLNTTFAKDVFFLAKVQLAAALNTGASASAYLTAQNFTDYGITGVSDLTTPRKDDLIARIVATANNGIEVDTRVEVQALVDKVVALGKIQDYAAAGTTAPTLADYTAAGVTGVTSDNLAAVNLRVLNSDAAGTSTDALVQSVVTTGVTAYTTAVAKIADYADLNTNPAPTLADYVDAGITGVTATNLAAVNTKIDAAVKTGADATAEIQALANSGIAAYGDALVIIKAYIGDSSLDAPTASTYAAAGLPTIDTADEVANANYYLTHIFTPANANNANATILNALTAQQAALAKINDYAVSSANPAPSVADYVAAGITNATTGSLSDINVRVDAATGVTTVAALKALIDPVFSSIPTLTSIALAGTSVANGAFQNDTILNTAELGATVKFTVTFDRAVNGLTSSNFALVDSSSGVSITGATPGYTITTTDNKVFTISVTGLTGMTNSTLRLDLVNNTGITDASSGNGCATTSYTSGPSYSIDTNYNTTIVAATGEDLTLTSSETAAHIFVDASKLSVGDTLALKLTGGASLVTVTVTAADIAAGGVTLTVNKSALTAPAEGAASDHSNPITLTHTDTSGNVSDTTGTIVVARSVTVSGTVGLGPVVSTADLTVTAYDVNGNLLSQGTVDAATGKYTLTINQSYTGPMVLKLTSTGTGVDYRDEATNTTVDLGSSSISAVANASGANVTANITTLTDIAARLLTVSGGLLASGTVAAKVDAANLLVTKTFIDPTSTASIVSLTPDFTVDKTGVVNTTASRYGQLLAGMSKQIQTTGTDLSFVQASLANSVTFNYNTSTPASSTMTLGQAAKDTVFLAKVAQAAQLSATSGVSSVLTAQDLIDYGITGFGTLSGTRQTDVITRIVNGANDGSGTDSINEVVALVAKVTAIGVIQDYKTSAGSTTAPTLSTYADAGITGVTSANLAAVNNQVLATVADITANPDSVIAAAATAGATAQTAALAVIAAYATSNASTAPTVADYANAGITGVTTANLASVNAKVDAAAAADVNTVALAQTVVNTGVVANSDALTVIRNYLADSVNNTAPTQAQYRDANLAAVTTADQVSNANYLLGKVLAGTTLTDAQIGTKLSDQIAAIKVLNDYAVANTAVVPTVADYTKAGLTQVTDSNLAEINARVDALATVTQTAGIITLLKAIDLDAGTNGLQTTATANVGGATLATAKAIFANVNATYTDDIKSISIAVTGADATYDTVSFGTVSKLLNTAALTGSGITVNTVTGVDWSYGADQKFVFTKTDGSAFTAAQAKLIEQALSFTSVTTTSNTQGARVFTVTHTDTAGVVSSSASSTLALDTQVVAVDLSAATAGVQNTSAGFVNSTQATAGKSLVAQPIAKPTDTDIKQISIVIGGAGLDVANDKLMFDVLQSLNGNFSATLASGVNYTYTASTKTLVLSMANGASFATSSIPGLINGISFKTGSLTDGDRTFTISYIDQLGNTGTAATSTLTVDRNINAPILALAVDDGTSTTDKITTNGQINVSGVDATDTWSYSLDSGTTWTVGTGSSIASSAMGAAGAKTVQVKATDAAGNTATSTLSFTLAAAITKTASITGETDNASINGSVGSTTTPVAVANGASTDDTTPTLSGTVSASLAAGEVVGIYDGTTKLGNAAVTGTTWSYTPTALAAGAHSFTAKVENTTTGAAGAASTAYTTQVYNGLTMTVADDVGATQLNYNKARYIMLRKDLSAPNPDGYWNIGEVQVMSNGVNVALNKSVTVGPQGAFVAASLVDGTATAFETPLSSSSNAWIQIDLGAEYDISSILLSTYNYSSQTQARLSNTQVYYSTSDMIPGVATTTVSQPPAINAVSYGSTGSVTGASTITLTTSTMAAVSTDDNQLTFAGKLDAPVGAGEEVAIYKTIGGVTTKVGVATVTDLNWTFTPSSAIGDGAGYTFKAMVQPVGDTAGTAGRVVSATTGSITINSAAITKTASITGGTDDAQINGSATGALVNGASTDDTTPALSGTVSASLTGTEVVGIYDGTTKLGNAAVTGTTWSYTPTALAAGAHSFTAKVENTTTGAAGAASTAYTTQVYNGMTMTVADDVGATTGVVTQTTANYIRYIMVARDLTASDQYFVANEIQVMSNGVNVAQGKTAITQAALGSQAANGAGLLFDGATNNYGASNGASGNTTYWVQIDLGANYLVDQIVVTPNAALPQYLKNTYVYGSTSSMTVGANAATAPTGVTSFGNTGTVIGSSNITLGITNVSPVSTDDNTPTLSGTLAAALGASEELGVYDGTTLLGVATVTGTSWAYTPSTALSWGSHTLKAMVQTTGNTSSTAGKVVSLSVPITIDTTLPTKTAAITGVTDNINTNGSLGTTGSPVAVDRGTTTDDNTPTINGTISATLAAGEVVSIYDGATKLGTAIVSGTNWFYTPATLAAGAHSFTAKVENSATGAAGTASAAFTTKVVNTLGMTVLDDVGATTGHLATGAVTDDQLLTFAGSLPTTLGAGEELAIYQTLSSGMTTKLGVATVTTDGAGATTWSYTPATNLAVGTSTFKAMVQPAGDATGVAGKVVSASTSLTIGSVDTTFNNILSTDPTSGLAVKSLGVAAFNTLDMQAYSHNEIDVLNLSANATAKIDLADVMQNGLNLFNASNFSSALTGTTSLHQLVVNGAAGSAVVVDSAALSGTWTKSATSVTNNSHTYDVYNNNNGTAQLLIDQLVSRSGAVI